MMLPLVLLAAAAAAAPSPAPTLNDLALFGDWTVGCDNGRACQAVALMPDDWPDDAATMVVSRGAEAGAAPILSFALGESADGGTLEADGQKLAVRLTGSEVNAKVAPADAAKVVAALRTAGRLRIVGRNGAALGMVSLKGASAALLYMDDRQRRVGTVTALVRPGTKPATSVPAPPALPIVRSPAARGLRPIAVPAARIAALRKQLECTIEDVGGPDEVEIHALDPSRSLFLLTCGSGAYNVTHIPFVVSRAGGQLRIDRAQFDWKPGWSEDGPPMLVNADWSSETGLLGSFAKGRGLGDCGSSENYAWDGARFRLVEQAVMGECRGSVDYITTWRARVVRR